MESLVESKKFMYIQTDTCGNINNANGYFRSLYPELENVLVIINPDELDKIPKIEDCKKYDNPIEIHISIKYVSVFHPSVAFISSYNREDVDCIIFPIWNYPHLINHDLTRPVASIIGAINLLDRESADHDMIFTKLKQSVKELEQVIMLINRVQ